MKVPLLLLIVATVSAHQLQQNANVSSSFTITWDCYTCPGTFQYNCFYYNGGPFNNFVTPINSSYRSCYTTGRIFPIYINFNCGDACTNCGYTITEASIPRSTCADSSDGANFIRSLNQLYGTSQGDSRKTYDWCGSAGCSTDLTNPNIWLIIGIGAGVLVLIAVVVVCVRWRRKQAILAQYMNTDQYQAMIK